MILKPLLSHNLFFLFQHPLPTLLLSSITLGVEPKSSCPEVWSLQEDAQVTNAEGDNLTPAACTHHPPVTVSSLQTEQSPSNLALALRCSLIQFLVIQNKTS